jgi:hypothetical protein
MEINIWNLTLLVPTSSAGPTVKPESSILNSPNVVKLQPFLEEAISSCPSYQGYRSLGLSGLGWREIA